MDGIPEFPFDITQVYLWGFFTGILVGMVGGISATAWAIINISWWEARR